ncbi:hypothetical protein K1719_044817 [Acacia pycnantha]|nr:hypothetical protein K1719_044817 [Acacia pycnantha]
MILHNPFFLFILIMFLLYITRVVLFKTGLMYTIKKCCRIIEDCFYVYQSFRVPELYEDMLENPLYRKVSLYLHSLPSLEDSDFTNLITGKKNDDIVLCLDPKQTIEDDFLGARVFWLNEGDEKTDSNRNRAFILKIRKADKRRILRPYLQHIHTIVDEGKRDLRLFMITDPIGGEIRSRIVPQGEQYYNRHGRAWKRSFLLYGPSGTGKSSFVAAMANFLCYNVYDMDLSKVPSDSGLKSMLLQTTAKSIIVVEDLDRFLIEKSKAVSLSGILNFMDGILTSCCAEEMFQKGASLSSAEIGELMITNRNSPSRAIKSVINALQTDGNGRGRGGKIVRQLGGRAVDVTEETDGVLCSDGFHTVKDLRRLYGFFRSKNHQNLNRCC